MTERPHTASLSVLTSETKRRINACRDILVGKLPQPAQQVELITLALIYKFMDDLDEESVAMGGSLLLHRRPREIPLARPPAANRLRR